MGIAARALERRSTVSLAHPRDPGILQIFGGGAKTSSGISVTPDTARTVTAINRAVRLLANTMGVLPTSVMERLPNNRRQAAPNHPISRLLRRPNRWQKPFEWKRMVQGHIEMRGNAYNEVITDGRGRVVELIPLHPDRIKPRSGVLREGFEHTIWYEYSPMQGSPRVILWDDMLHFRGYSEDGLVGLSTIETHRDAIGLSIANREFTARYFANNASPGGAIKMQKPLSKDGKALFKQSWNEAHGGVEHVGKVAILDEGMEWVSLGFNPEQSQLIENKRWDIEEVARMFDIPPHKLMDLMRSTNNNIEHQGIEWVQDAILPRAVNFEETLERDLFLPSDEDRYYVEANIEGLKRGDSAARAALYTAMFNMGALTPNDIRQKENVDPIEGGDEAYIQMNLVPLRLAAQLAEAQASKPDPKELPAEEPEPPKQLPAGDEEENADEDRAFRARLTKAHERLFVDAIGRVLRKEVQAGRRALKDAIAARSSVPLETWMDEFYPKHERFVADALEPVIVSLGESIGDDVPGLAEALQNGVMVGARSHVAYSRTELRKLIAETTPAEMGRVLGAAFDTWEAERAKVAGVQEAAVTAQFVTEYVNRPVAA